jgi:uncharacterized membrane protein YcaP (DUF421 family)
MSVDIDWHRMLVPSEPLVEMVVRGSIMYLALFILLRVILKRRAGGLSTPDVLLIVLIADAAQNGMANEYKSVTEGLALVTTILVWDYALDWLAYSIPALSNLIEPAPLLLVKDGRVLRHNLRAELLTLSDLQSLLREKGIVDVSKVRRAHLEPTGHLSVSPSESR